MSNFIYLRGLRHAEHTVFCVQEGQKFYYDNQFGTKCAYSSGQQVKRSILDNVLENLNEPQAPITFIFEKSGEKIKTKEPLSPCDPRFTEQLLGGWMRAESTKSDKSKKKNEDEENEKSEKQTGVIKRRSPLSISAMRPLHPLLGGLESQKEDITFDRSAKPHLHPVVVKDSAGNVLTDEQVNALIEGRDKEISRRSWIPDNTRAGGLFVYDVAIDLRTLFAVSTTNIEPEVDKNTLEKLQSEGWIKSENAFGECLICPKERREKIIPALVSALLNWRITSNQSRTFSLMETLAVAISRDASALPSAIRAELSSENERSAIPVLDRNSGADLFVTPPCNGYIRDAHGTNDALKNAYEKLVDLLMKFDYENQIK